MTPSTPDEPIERSITNNRKWLSASGWGLLFTCISINLIAGAISGLPVAVGISSTLAMIIAALLLGYFIGETDSNESHQNTTTSAEQASLRGEERMADSLNLAIIIVGQNRSILYANIAARTLFKLETLGQPFSTLIRAPDIVHLINNALDKHLSGHALYQQGGDIDQHFRIIASPMPMHSEHPERNRAIIIFNDITEVVRATSLRSDFLANASHELKTPVASILGYVETLQGHAKNDAEAREKFLRIMKEQGERMQRLIHDLLSLRRIELNEHEAPNTVVNASIAVRTALEVLAPDIEKKNIEIQFSNPKVANVLGDSDELVQLTLNLIDNAIQISPEGSKIHVSMEMINSWSLNSDFSGSDFDASVPRRRIIRIPQTGESYLRLRIRDFATGFDSEHLPRIGERFYRITGGRSPHNKGTGLGLAIAKHIILRHRGGFFVESKKEQGTCFTVALPVSET